MQVTIVSELCGSGRLPGPALYLEGLTLRHVVLGFKQFVVMIEHLRMEGPVATACTTKL